MHISFGVLFVTQSAGCLHFRPYSELSESLSLNEWVNSNSIQLKLTELCLFSGFDAISWDRAQMAIKLSNHRFIYSTMAAVLTVIFSLYSIRNECQYWAKEWQERTSLSVWIQEERLTNPSSGSSAVSFLWLQMESVWVGHMYQGTACRISQKQKWEQNIVGRTTGTLWKSFCNIVQATHVKMKTARHFFPSVGRVY